MKYSAADIIKLYILKIFSGEIYPEPYFSIANILLS
jgi:hypothetical protein